MCIGLHGPKSPCKGDRGKHPAVKFGTATIIEPPDATLAMWFNGSPRNIGIACKPSGLLVIDEDMPDALADLATQLGESLPVTYRVRTRRGWHYYFTAPAGVELGNSAGALATHGMDVRGGGGEYGGYVVGEGSVHECGLVYEAEDWQVLPAPLPEWLIGQIKGGAESSARSALPRGQTIGRLRKARPYGDYPDGWDDLPRTGTAAELTAQYRRHLDAVQTPGGAFRHELFLAALDGWRLVGCGLLTEDVMQSGLTAAIRRVWGEHPDYVERNEDDDQHILDGKNKAALSPWIVVAESDGEDGRTEDNGTDGTVDPYTLALAAEVRKERLRREARAVLAAEDAVPLVSLSGAAFLAAPTPVPLVESLLYEDGLHQIFGAEGSGKSLFVLDVALSLAAGVPIDVLGASCSLRKRSAPRVPLPVHYVMAEGQAVNVERTHAWLNYHELEPSAIDLFTAIPTAVSLTRPGVEPYLEIVRRDRPVLVILDTKIVMMEGNENLASDNAELVRAMHLIRSVNGACVWLVDHTGQHDRTRSRGGPAMKAATETQHRCEEDPETGFRTVWLERDKGGKPGAHWSFRLKSVDPAVVCVPVTEEDRSIPFAAGDGWWRHDAELVPDEIAELSGKGHGAARDIFRVLTYVGMRDGLTSAQLRAMVAEGPHQYARSTFFAGVALLQENGVLVTGSTPTRLALADRFSDPGE